MKFLRNILIVFVPFYFFATWLRNFFYDRGLLTSTAYDFPLICVGNLSVGGTGKTPMIEYLIRLLMTDHKIATLSRGYKRKTKGFMVASSGTTVAQIGDEPYQFYRKFRNVTVSVDANRRSGIFNLMKLDHSPDIILLDDAFQHRKVRAGLNLLLTAFDKLYVDDFVLPTGDLREPRSGASRAQIIVVTKCPADLSEEVKRNIIAKLRPNFDQKVFFSTICYSKTVFSEGRTISLEEIRSIKFTLVTGIANAQPLVDYLKENNFEFDHFEYKDHHRFSDREIALLDKRKLILTTEKDYWRLSGRIDANKLHYLPIELEIFEGSEFNGLIKNFISN